MNIEFDPVKSERNERERGLPFEMVADMEWESALIGDDDRMEYGEERRVALVPLKGRVYVVCYTLREEIRRVISFRKANKREAKIYDQETNR